MFSLISCFLSSRNKNTENEFLKENIFFNLFKIIFFATVFSFYPKPPYFHFIQNERFLILTENTGNGILLFPIFDSFKKIFSLKIFSKIQPNASPLPFFIFSENKNKKQLNQTPLT